MGLSFQVYPGKNEQLTFHPVRMTSSNSFFSLALTCSKSRPCIKPIVPIITPVNAGEKPT